MVGMDSVWLTSDSGNSYSFSLGNSHGQHIFLFVSEFSAHVLAPMPSRACDVQDAGTDVLTPGIAVCILPNAFFRFPSPTK